LAKTLYYAVVLPWPAC